MNVTFLVVLTQFAVEFALKSSKLFEIKRINKYIYSAQEVEYYNSFTYA
jgi:hypothetical protein